MKTGKILLTGCTGLVGHGIGSYFLRAGFEIHGTSRRKLKSLHPKFSSSVIDLLRSDVNIWIEALTGVKAVIHCAGALPGDKSVSTEGFYRTNLLGTASLLEAVRLLNPAIPVVYISTTGFLQPVDGKISGASPEVPRNAYAASKLCGEIVCRQMAAESGMKVKILRIRAPFGYKPTANAVIPKFIDAAEKSENILLWGTGARTQTFTFVEDIARAAEMALASDRIGTWIITGPRGVTMRETAEAVLSVFSKSKSKIVFPGVPDPQESACEIISIAEARADFGYSPVFELVDALGKIAKKEGLEFFALEGQS